MKPELLIWHSEQRKVADLTPHPQNPRQASAKEIRDLRASLERFNVADPIVINTTGRIIGGHLRVSVLKSDGIQDVDVRVPSRELTEYEELELCLRLNKNGGRFDNDILAGLDVDMLKEVGWGDEEMEVIFQIGDEVEDLKKEIIDEQEWADATKTSDEAIEAMTVKIRKAAMDNPKKMNQAHAVIVNNGRGNACLFLSDPNTADIIKELQRLADSGEPSPLDALVRSLL